MNPSQKLFEVFRPVYRVLRSAFDRRSDDFLDAYSRENPGLRFIQIGANDCVNNDLLYQYICRDGWRGVLFEPQRYVYTEFTENSHPGNDDIQTVNAAVGHEDGEATLHKVAFSTQRWATGLASFDRSVLESGFESGYVARRAAQEGVKVPEAWEERISEETVSVLSLSTILDRYEIEELDLLAMDTEGFDFEIIKMIDFDRVRPRVILFESLHLKDEDKRACRALLEAQGYTLYDDGVNAVAMRDPSPSLQWYFA